MIEEGPVEDGPYVPDPIHEKRRGSPKNKDDNNSDSSHSTHREKSDNENVNKKSPKKRSPVDNGAKKVKQQSSNNNHNKNHQDNDDENNEKQNIKIEITTIDDTTVKIGSPLTKTPKNNRSDSSNALSSPFVTEGSKYALSLNGARGDLTPHCYVQKGHSRFLITGTPNDDNLLLYLNLYRQYGVSTVVRLCEAVYDVTPLIQANILVLEMPFADGEVAPFSIIEDWLHIVDNVFAKKEQETICVHCYTGIGRAPFLVSLALIENDMEPADSIALLRTKIEGAITDMQSEYIERYRPRQKFRCCVIC